MFYAQGRAPFYVANGRILGVKGFLWQRGSKGDLLLTQKVWTGESLHQKKKREGGRIRNQEVVNGNEV